MRYAAWLFFLLGIPGFAQTPPDNAALGALKSRLESMNVFKAPRAIRPIANGAPKICSVPLLNVMPTAGVDRMRVIKPPAAAVEAMRGMEVQVPAPACR